MAILDILTFEGATMENSFSRGNGGVLVDMNASRFNELLIPAGSGGVCDYPAENDVRSGVAFDIYTGNLTLPPVGDVDSGVQYGGLGTEFTGTLVKPAVGNVKSGVGYGASGTELTGTRVDPAQADVKFGVQYGAGGVEFTGSLVAGGGGSNIFISID